MNTFDIFSKTDIVIRAGRVFDGQSFWPNQNIDIVVSGGTIQELRQAVLSSPPRDNKTEILDLSNYTILPALIDCHVHLALDGKDFNSALELWEQEELLTKRIISDLNKTLERGIAAVRDGGDRNWIGLRVRNEITRGAISGPRVIATGIALGRRGKYGSFLGPGITGEQIRKSVENAAMRGVDQIKVLVSGVVSFKNYRRVGEIHFSPAELGDLVAISHSLGLKVMAHASSDEASLLAVNAGVDSLEHGYFIEESTLEKMAALKIPWIPTLAPVANQARGELRKGHTTEELEVIEKTYKRQLYMVKKAYEMGVPLGAGTDAGATGVLHGEGLLDELLLMEEAGLLREEILRAATGTAANILGVEKEMGFIRPGMPPCLIALRGNPMDDLNALKNIALMIMPLMACPA
ncbi:MAG: amidohydrolase family protein [Bacillota bacterium]